MPLGFLHRVGSAFTQEPFVRFPFPIIPSRFRKQDSFVCNLQCRKKVIKLLIDNLYLNGEEC